ncbi:phosphatidylglycerophosphatase A [Verrucomicrobiota bacterium]
MLNILVLLLATGLGLGFSPLASGTVGTLIGVLIVLLMGFFHVNLAWQIVIAVILIVLAIPICDKAEKFFGTKDDGRIVADEYMTFPLCMLGLPWSQNLWLLGLAFLSHRLFDIIKPPPARQIQELHGGTGIVLDDVISSLYALALNHAVWAAYKWIY